MLKKSLLIALALVTTGTVLSMQKSTLELFVQVEDQVNKAEQWIEIKCPNCFMTRLFPSSEFITTKLAHLSESDKVKMVQAVTNYTGDIVPGRYCPFCGFKILK